MMILGFVVLSLVLFAAVGTLGYLLARKQATEALTSIQRHVRKVEKQRRKELKTFREQLRVMTENIKIIAGERKKDILINTEGMAPWQASMETRAIEAERNKVVAVDNKVIGLKKSA